MGRDGNNLELLFYCYRSDTIYHCSYKSVTTMIGYFIFGLAIYRLIFYNDQSAAATTKNAEISFKSKYIIFHLDDFNFSPKFLCVVILCSVLGILDDLLHKFNHKSIFFEL